MGLFDKVNNSTNVAAEADSVKGAKREMLPSDIYNCLIKFAYGSLAKSGAVGVNLVLTTPEGREIKMTEYVTSGDAKGNKTYYESDKKDSAGNITGKEQRSLPGFLLIDSLCQLALGKSIVACTQEKRTINLYNFDAKKELPAEVDMFIELVGQPICAAVLNQIQDKTAKDPQSGKYEPTGKTYSTNVVDKFLHPQDRRTWSEKKADIAADFAEKWLAKWKGQIDDQSSSVKGAGLKGAPAPSGDAAPKAALFG